MARFSEEQKAVLDQVMHAKICEAAIQVISKYGIERMTMNKVAEAAGVAKGTIYNYFKDKNELLVHIEDMAFGPLIKTINEIATSNSTALLRLQQIARMLFEHFCKYKKLLLLLHEAKTSGIIGNKQRFKNREKLIAIVEKIISSSMEAGELRSFTPRVVAEIFLGMIMSINISQIITAEKRSVQQDLDAVMTIFTKGIQQNITNNEDTTNEN